MINNRFKNMRNKIKKFFAAVLIEAKFVYHKTPESLHFIFLPVKCLKSLRLDVWIIEGEETISKRQLSFLYAGNEKQKNYIAKLAFASSCKERYLGKTWLWKILKKRKHDEQNCSLLFVEMYHILRIFLKFRKHFYIPRWVSGETEISGDISAVVQPRKMRNIKSDISRNKLSFELVSEPSLFDYFYYDMYVPYITNAHGDRAFIKEYALLKKQFESGDDLLLVKKEEEYIAGLLLTYTKDKARLRLLGVKHASSEYVKGGAIGALYYFSILHAQEKGFKTVSFGESRAFLRDGILQYKRKWNVQIVAPSESGFFLTLLTQTGGVKGFLLNHPFIYRANRRLYGAIFVDVEEPFSQKELRKLSRRYCFSGISQLIIYQFGKNRSKHIEERVPVELKDKIIIRSAESLF